MRYLNLSSSDLRYKCDIPAKKCSWELQMNLEETKFALTSLKVLLKTATSYSLITVKTNLLDRNYLNPNGILCVVNGSSKVISTDDSNPPFWKLEFSRPREITLEFTGIEVSNIKSINAVFAFQ